MGQSSNSSTGFKEYRSVTEFPKHLQKLSREDLEVHYQDLRESYRSLSISRGQLVRRQSEAKGKLTDLSQSLTQVQSMLKTVETEKQKLKQSLAHSVDAQKQLQGWGDNLSSQVDDLTTKINATNSLIQQFESVYEEVNENRGLLSFGRRFVLLMKAAQKMLNTDIQDLISKPALSSSDDDSEDWTKEDQASVNRALLDD
ncbi:MAG: hypothetical protein ACFBSC_07075 [Microcoleaceae cyanobacterium]